MSKQKEEAMTVEDDLAGAAAAAVNDDEEDEAARQRRYVRERLERKPSEQITLDDIIYEMQASRGAVAGPPSGQTGPDRAAAAESGVFSSSSQENGVDLYSQLEQKERDLVLAAELGKALLDKNEELSRQNERIAEEFSARLEVSEKLPPATRAESVNRLLIGLLEPRSTVPWEMAC